MKRALVVLLILSLPLALVACGGEASRTAVGGGDDTAASVAPSSTALFVTLDTDRESSQWQALESLADRFPALEAVFSDGDFQEFLDATGAETSLLALTFDDVEESHFVGLTQPENEAEFRQLVESGDDAGVSEEVEGWQVVADERSTIDRFKRERLDGTLGNTAAYEEASAELPADRLVSFFIPGGPIADAIAESLESEDSPIPGIGRIAWVSGALAATESGVGLEFRARGDEISTVSFTPDLVDEVPAGVYVLLSFKGLDEALEDLKQHPAVERRLGAGSELVGDTIDRVIALFENESVLYARPGSPLPEVTLAIAVPDPADALAKVDELMRTVGAAASATPEDVDVSGIAAKKLTLSGMNLYYAGFEGKLVVTTAPSGIEGLSQPGTRLPEDPIYTEATEAASLPEQTAGFAYLNLSDLLPLVESLTDAGDRPLSDEVKENLEALHSLVLFAGVDAGELLARGFLSVK